MECAIHPGRDSVGVCRLCGRAVCELCGIERDGCYACSRCDPASGPGDSSAPPPGPGAAPPAPPLSPAAWDTKRKSPGLAALLSLIPGLGQLYNGQAVKGIVFLAVFFGLVQLTEHDDFVALFVVVFYLYAVYDAYRTARQINAAVADASRTQAAAGATAPGFVPETEPRRPSDLSLSFNTREGSRVWGYLLVALGALLLLANLGIPVLHLVRVLWPVGLIVLGARLLKRYMGSEGR